MKGLLTKDFRTIFNQNKSFLLLFVIAIIVVFTMNDGENFIAGYGAVIAIIFTTNTMSYDTLDNGYTFMFTLPVTRRQYIYEKFLLGCITLVLCCVYTFTLGMFKTRDISLVVNYIVMIGFGLIMLSIMIPLQIKFGAEKLRIAIFIIAGVSVCIVMGAKFLLEKLQVNGPVVTMATKLGNASPVVLITMVVLCIIAIVGASMFTSIKILEKKEF